MPDDGELPRACNDEACVFRANATATKPQILNHVSGITSPRQEKMYKS